MTVLFLGASFLIVYVMFVYPLLLGVLARRNRRPVHAQPQQKAVSVIIAVHNGERYIADKLRSVLALDYPRELLEILVASDGSTDETDTIVESFAAQGVQLLKLPRGGKCAALNAAIPRAKGEILLLSDVRQTIEPDSLGYLVNCFADPQVGVVSGELIVRKGLTHGEANTGLYWKYESWIRNCLGSIDSIFGATGPFYTIRRDLAVPIPTDMLLDDVYLPLAAFFRGYRLIVETRARAYDYPMPTSVEFRRKVRTLAGNYQILMAYPALLTPRNRMWVHFLSYKVGRLLLPWLLILVALASFGLPLPWRVFALAGQAVFYALAALDPAIPPKLPLKRLSSPIHTFVAMMVAAACAVSVFFVPAQRLWKVTSAGTQVKPQGHLR